MIFRYSSAPSLFQFLNLLFEDGAPSDPVLSSLPKVEGGLDGLVDLVGDMLRFIFPLFYGDGLLSFALDGLDYFLIGDLTTAVGFLIPDWGLAFFGWSGVLYFITC